MQASGCRRPDRRSSASGSSGCQRAADRSAARLGSCVRRINSWNRRRQPKRARNREGAGRYRLRPSLPPADCCTSSCRPGRRPRRVPGLRAAPGETVLDQIVARASRRHGPRDHLRRVVPDRFRLDGQPAPLRVQEHPLQRDARQGDVIITAADVGVNTANQTSQSESRLRARRLASAGAGGMYAAVRPTRGHGSSARRWQAGRDSNRCSSGCSRRQMTGHSPRRRGSEPPDCRGAARPRWRNAAPERRRG